MFGSLLGSGHTWVAFVTVIFAVFFCLIEQKFCRCGILLSFKYYVLNIFTHSVRCGRTDHMLRHFRRMVDQLHIASPYLNCLQDPSRSSLRDTDTSLYWGKTEPIGTISMDVWSFVAQFNLNLFSFLSYTLAWHIAIPNSNPGHSGTVLSSGSTCNISPSRPGTAWYSPPEPRLGLHCTPGTVHFPHRSTVNIGIIMDSWNKTWKFHQLQV